MAKNLHDTFDEAAATAEGMPPMPDEFHSRARGHSARAETDTDVKEALRRAIPEDLTLRDALGLVRDKLGESVADAIRARPAIALGGAFAVGLIAVALVTRT